ncbi:DUF3365 domain-containing protein [Algibacter sp. AS12]|uniref:c-type heme family protein n=1 Tax=Algibacter sp. AS12 TaxID=3135773 RepID=UPI00398BA453
MPKLFITLLLFTFFLNCNNSKNKSYTVKENQENAEQHPGKKLMETNCYVCHSTTASEANRIGPPMIAIKKHYIDNNTTKEAFIKSMQAWIKNPNKEDAKMYGAVKRFGVMPKQAYPEETIKNIAEYMYDFKIEQPEWFEDHYKKHKSPGNGQEVKMGNGNGKQNEKVKTSFTNLPYGERGQKYALTTKAVLGKNLMGTIQKKGTLEALAFCNERAYPLTDSMAVVHNATIKRVSDKPRNSNNKADLEELEHIKTFKQVIANNEEPKPIVKEANNKVNVYYPITTNTMCLQCHGKPNETLKPSTLKTIRNLYPKDKAIGYDVNEVRGIWSITFDK